MTCMCIVDSGFSSTESVLWSNQDHDLHTCNDKGRCYIFNFMDIISKKRNICEGFLLQKKHGATYTNYLQLKQ